jgi:ATP-dependent 26S proteasome regulatory subunit
LHRIESFPGLVIFATNLKENINNAFTRKFQSIIHFTMPSKAERLQLWKKAFSGKCELDTSIDIENIAEQFELTGGAIINILRYCALTVIPKNETIVSKRDLLKGIRREFKKDGAKA